MSISQLNSIILINYTINYLRNNCKHTKPKTEARILPVLDIHVYDNKMYTYYWVNVMNWEHIELSI